MNALVRVFVSSCLVALSVSALHADEIVERVMAVVEGRPVLLSDVRALARLRGLEPDAALEALIDERLMLHEATRLPQVSLLPEEEERALEALLAEHAEAASIPRPALRRLARRQALILRYVELRFRPLVRITEADLRAAYERRFAEQPQAPAYADVAEQLREEILAGELDRRLETWIADLRRSLEVRYVEGP